MADVAVTTITHTKNAATTLPRLLETTEWAKERIVVDMQSQDETVPIARQAGCRVLEVDDAPCVDGVRNRFLSEATTEWVFVLDADEYLADDGAEGVQELISQHGAGADAFAIPRFNLIGDQIMQGSGWYPDHQIRLFRRGCVQWSDGNHHAPTVTGGDERLFIVEPPRCLHIHHANYVGLQDFIERQLRYVTTDTYDDDENSFDFNSYVAEAYDQYDFRGGKCDDGDLSIALGTVMAWDRVMRGLIHWERLGRRPSLAKAFSLPIVTQPRRRERELADELANIKRGLFFRAYQQIHEWFPRAIPFVGRCLRQIGKRFRGD